MPEEYYTKQEIDDMLLGFMKFNEVLSIPQVDGLETIIENVPDYNIDDISTNWQKVKVTNDDGTIPRITDFDFTDVSTKLPATSGFYYVYDGLNAEANGISFRSGYLQFNKHSDIYMELRYRPYNSTDVYIKWKHGNNWTIWIKGNNEYESIVNSDSKIDGALNTAKKYAEDRTVVLYEGTANGVGTPINLSESLDNFHALIMYTSTPGGTHVDIANPYGTENIFIKSINIPDKGTNGGAIFECGIQKMNRKQLKIIHDVFLDLATFQGSGPNANRVTVTRIVGIRKGAN
ncbi:pyocin knob domain-containing protein [Mammaliicoccus sciuri]|uniref:pyocin knob domain-containing protein n=1 Tax=Mammaliicoccus sciuri TaxID=1296 RepID=UPI0013301ED0|nr:pyocin knob domain-containing protein [Mammaliicoccus sciuri]